MIKYIIAGTVICLSILMWVPTSQEDIKTLPRFETIGLTGQVVTEDIFKDGGVLHFFRSTCGYCLLEMPGWRILKRQHPNFKIVLVLHKQTLEEAATYFSGTTWPFDEVIYDLNDILWQTLDAEYTPQSWLINTDLEAIHKFGVMDAKDFQKLDGIIKANLN
jgi:thiol-disulfide isomerase/thioredoxin